jgi:predicted component of type VI protein secretion system
VSDANRFYKTLRALSEDELIERFDTDLSSSGGLFRRDFLDEIDRRDRARGEQAALALARASNRLSIIAVVVSVVTLTTGVVLPLITR